MTHVKRYHENCLLKFSWDDVVNVFWKRYPNPFAKHVLAEDVLNRKLLGGKLFTTRLIVKSGVIPKWGEFMFKDKSTKSYIVEDSIVDPGSQTITTYTRNVSLTSYSVLEEKCVYKPSDENKNWTLCERSAQASSAVRFLAPRITQFVLARYQNNVHRTDKGWDYIIRKFEGRPRGSVLVALAKSGVHKQAKLIRP